MAISCLPYELPKLAVVAQVSENDFAALLDQRIERMKAIEARGSRRMCRPTNQVSQKRYDRRLARRWR